MEQSTKRLKISSILVLVLAGISLLNIIFAICFGDLNSAEIPEGSPENILMITKIFILSFSLLLLLPRFFVGFKGLWIAKNRTSSKGHIIWAIIILVFSVIGLPSSISDIVKAEAIGENILSIFNVLLEVAVYYEYIKHARAVANEN